MSQQHEETVSSSSDRETVNQMPLKVRKIYIQSVLAVGLVGKREVLLSFSLSISGPPWLGSD